jgi:NitT/TauT family transport system substrate-binding protein
MARGGIRPLFSMRDAMGVSQMIFWTARADFIAQHREALVDFLEDTIRALRWYTDPKNRDEAVAIVARVTKQKPEDLRPWLLTEQDFYRDPNATPNLEALQRNLDTLREVGFLKDRFEARPHTDLSLVEAARSRLR